jgi:hypothetical protein
VSLDTLIIDREIDVAATTAFPDTFRNPGEGAPIRAVAITNTGDAVLHVTQVTLDTVAGDVWTLLDTAAQDIPAGATAEYRVRFSPTTLGTQPSATVTIASDDRSEPTVTVTFSGTAIDRNVQFGGPQRVDPRLHRHRRARVDPRCPRGVELEPLHRVRDHQDRHRRRSGVRDRRHHRERGRVHAARSSGRHRARGERPGGVRRRLHLHPRRAASSGRRSSSSSPIRCRRPRCASRARRCSSTRAVAVAARPAETPVVAPCSASV